MPVGWIVACYGCWDWRSNGHGDKPTVAYWTLAELGFTIGLCREHLDAWLDEADEGHRGEPLALEFLIPVGVG